MKGTAWQEEDIFCNWSEDGQLPECSEIFVSVGLIFALGKVLI